MISFRKHPFLEKEQQEYLIFYAVVVMTGNEDNDDVGEICYRNHCLDDQSPGVGDVVLSLREETEETLLDNELKKKLHMRLKKQKQLRS